MLRLIITGVLFVIIGIPFYLEKIGPNRWFGFRAPKTFSSCETWYAANKMMGTGLIIAGAALLVSALVLAIISQQYPGLPLKRVSFVIILSVLCLLAVHSFWTLSRL